MVLLPGCVCCGSCDPPPVPDSVEVDITQAAASGSVVIHRKAINYPQVDSDVTVSISLSAASGSYSLNSYQYAGNIDITYDPGMYTPRPGNVLQSLTVIHKNVTIQYGSSTCTNISWLSRVEMYCDTSRAKHYEIVPPSTGLSQYCGGQYVYGRGVGAFPVGCRLPVQLTINLMIDVLIPSGLFNYTLTDNTFNTTNELSSGGNHVIQLGLSVPFTISEMRFIYGTTAVTHFGDVGDTGCVTAT